jgi:hypothetical protein
MNFKILLSEHVIKYISYICLITFSFLSKKNSAQTKYADPVIITDGATSYKTPLLFEMVNVGYALMDTSTKGYFNAVDTSSNYYKEVITQFGLYKNHKYVKKLNKKFKRLGLTYIMNVGKSTFLVPQKNRIKFSSELSSKYRFLARRFGIRNRHLKSFLKETNFNAFYLAHKDYYESYLLNTKNNTNIDSVKQFLETEFPSKSDKYSIVMSSLMYGTHFTFSYKVRKIKTSAMWVSALTEKSHKKYSMRQLGGIYTGVIFTEIDHNYVNPVSDKYVKQLKKVMGGDNRKKWVDESGDAKYYKNGYDVFNEYMTHAVYLIYTNLAYNKTDQEVIVKSRIRMMEKRRKYIQFENFYNHLQGLYANRKAGETLATLYPQILSWCEEQNTK